MFIALNFIGAGDVRAKLPAPFSLSLKATFLSYEICLYMEASLFDCYCLWVLLATLEFLCVSYQLLSCSTFCPPSIQTPAYLLPCSSLILEQATYCCVKLHHFPSCPWRLLLIQYYAEFLPLSWSFDTFTSSFEKTHVLHPSEFVYSFWHRSVGFFFFHGSSVYLPMPPSSAKRNW